MGRDCVIKEPHGQNWIFCLDKMNQASFDGTEASLVLITIAYNFMSLFRQVVMPDKIKHRLSTLR